MGFGRTFIAAVTGAAVPLALACATPAAAQGKVTPLFAEDSVLEVVIDGPVNSIVGRATRSTDPFDATIAAGGETHTIALSARGVSRRNKDICRFPPLRVELKEKPGDASLFDGQRRIKLVTHCRPGAQAGQFVLKEMAAYRLYNVLTEESLKVRPVRVRYMDGGKQVAEGNGFFIEDIDDAARRVGAKEIDQAGLPGSVLDREDAARYTLFQYMIGNLDWDMTHAPQGEDCCHNSKLIGASKEARASLTPVPYDFDFSGLVGASYATPPEGIPVNKVTDRYYRGLCRHSAETQQQALAFLAARPALEAELGRIEGLEDRTRTGMLRFLSGFFDAISTPDRVERNLLRVCRR